MIDRDAAEEAMRRFLVAVGLDADDPTLAGTPRRVAEAAADLYRGIGVDPASVLRAGEPVEGAHPGPVAVRGIPFSSVCEHHLLPFRGTAAVAYLPDRRLAGIGDLPAALAVLAARPQIQERLTEQLVDAVDEALTPRGAIVRLVAEHSCMWARGGRTVGAEVVTVAARGAFALGAELGSEALALVGG